MEEKHGSKYFLKEKKYCLKNMKVIMEATLSKQFQIPYTILKAAHINRNTG